MHLLQGEKHQDSSGRSLMDLRAMSLDLLNEACSLQDAMMNSGEGVLSRWSSSAPAEFDLFVISFLFRVLL